MFERFFRQIDETRARAARDAGLPDPSPIAPPVVHPLMRWLARLVIAWIALLLLLLLLGQGFERVAPLTPLVILPGLLVRIGSFAGLVPDRIVGRRTSGEEALIGVLFWLVAALIAWVDSTLGGIASIALVLLLLRRINRLVLQGMYLAERARIRSGRGPSEPIAERGESLDAPRTGEEIAVMDSSADKETR